MTVALVAWRAVGPELPATAANEKPATAVPTTARDVTKTARKRRMCMTPLRRSEIVGLLFQGSTSPNAEERPLGRSAALFVTGWASCAVPQGAGGEAVALRSGY